MSGRSNEKRVRLLVVDDNTMNLELLRALLTTHDYLVDTASGAEEALRVLEREQPPPRLVLLDIQMPRMNGLELARRIRGDARFRDMRMIAVTAYPDFEDDAKQAGCDAFVLKPIVPKALLALVEEQLQSLPPATKE